MQHPISSLAFVLLVAQWVAQTTLVVTSLVVLIAPIVFIVPIVKVMLLVLIALEILVLPNLVAHVVVILIILDSSFTLITTLMLSMTFLIGLSFSPLS